MEDIYRAAGIMAPRKGYSITKVVEMLHSEHLRGASKEMKRAALLTALDAAGIPLEEIQKDAKARQDALDTHETEQTRQVEAEWDRKAEEVLQIQAELESTKAHFTARINRNLESVAREKSTFSGWLALKQQECQNMKEALELCLTTAVLEHSPASPPNPALAKGAAVGAKQEPASGTIQ
jgi:superfamily II DNA/RNA helicase